MNWKDIAGDVAKAAPVLGTLLGGPAGGMVGGWIAHAFGGNDSSKPEDIIKILQGDAEASVKLKQIELDHEKDIASLQVQLAITELNAARDTVLAVNQTMQAESKSEHWMQWAWRPFIGFITGISFGVVCTFFCILAYDAVVLGKSDALAMIGSLVTSFTSLFAIPGAILGVASYFRGKTKLVDVQNNGNTAND